MTSQTRSAIVVGGSGGIGAAVCRQLAADGFNVGLTYRGSEVSADKTAADVRAAGAQAYVRQIDLADLGSVGTVVDELAAELGSVDALVYAAGPYLPQLHVSRLPAQEFADQMTQDASGCYAVVQHAVPHLRAAQGTFLSISTPAVRRHVSRDILSSAPKAAIETIVRALAVEEGRFGVRANAVGVGVITAGMHQKLIDNGDFSEATLEAAKASIPLRRFGTAEDIAATIGFLASPAAAWISGQVLDVDGGWSA